MAQLRPQGLAKRGIRASRHVFDQMLGLGRRLLIGRNDRRPERSAIHYRSLKFSPKKICEYCIGAEVEPRGNHKPKWNQPIFEK